MGWIKQRPWVLGKGTIAVATEVLEEPGEHEAVTLSKKGAAILNSARLPFRLFGNRHVYATKDDALRGDPAGPDHSLECRICAICKKRTGAIAGFATALRLLGNPGNYAHERCIRREREHRRAASA